MQLDAEHCYEVVKARDARFDGVFFVGVSTTGVYCRPVCTVRTPGRDRCTFYPNAAAAEVAGYRPCLRCRPELAPGQAPIDAGRRVAAAALARIEAGALNQGSLEDLAAELDLSSRQLRRVIEAEYGVTPIALAQTQRLLLAKQLLSDTRLRVIDVAFASGFASLRQFNRLFKSCYRLRPSALRKRLPLQVEEGIVIKLGFRPPLAWHALLPFLAGRAACGTEAITGRRYLRAVRLGGRAGWFAAEPDARPNTLQIVVSPSLLPVLPELLARLRRLFDLTANPAVIDPHLARHTDLAALVRETPGLRVPGAMHGFELALRAVIGQQVTVKAATTIYGRFTATFGSSLQTPFPEISRLPPRPEDVANAGLQQLIDRGLTRKRAESVLALARAAAEGTLKLEPPADFAAAREALRALPGVGPWTCEYIAMRALGDPDAFPHADLGLLRALKLDKPSLLLAAAEGWRPWRAYAALHLWNRIGQGG